MSLSCEHAQERERGARLPREVLEEHVRGQGGVALVGAAHGRGEVIGADVQLQRARLGGHRFGVAGRGRDLLEVEVLGERMARELLGDRAGLRRAEPDEAEVVDRRQQAEELVLGHELADAREAALAVGGGADPRSLGQVARVDGAEEGLVRPVGDRLLEGAQGGEELRLDLRVLRQLARRLGAVAAEAGDVDERRARGEITGSVMCCLFNRIAVKDRRLRYASTPSVIIR